MGNRFRTILIAGFWVVALAAVFGLMANPAWAIDTGLTNAAKSAKLPTTSGGDVYTLIGNLIKAALGIVGIVFFVLMLYAGFLWMTAQGKADQIGKAKSMIIQAIIGLVIIFGAYTITNFVVNTLISSTSSTSTAASESDHDE